jgi:alpha-mannosidase
LALMLPGIGTDGDPVAMAKEQRDFQAATGVEQAIWLPGVGDHGGGPTAEMLEQLRLWEQQPQAVAQQPGTLRAYLEHLEPWRSSLPVWRDELYLELHRGCATSRPDQKRHNRSLERLLREAELAAALLGTRADALVPCHEQSSDWRPLLFQQFHDILPGTSIPEVFEQAEPIWCDARRRAAHCRDQLLGHLLASNQDGMASDPDRSRWAWCGLQPLAHWSPLLRLPQGHWSSGGQILPVQAAPSGGVWVQLPCGEGVCALPLQRSREPLGSALPIRHPVNVEVVSSGVWRLSNGAVSADVSAHGLVQLRDGNGVPQLSEPMRLLRFSDRGEFWDAWDLAADYRQHPLPMAARWSAELVESGPLAARIVLRTIAGLSQVRLDLVLKADSPWLEAQLSVQWQQTHELLRLELPLNIPAVRWAADTSGGVIERPAQAFTPFEQERWELPVISWLAAEAEAPGGGMAVLLEGPQGVDASANHLGVSLLRGPTWPDPSADHGWHRHRLAFMPAQLGWNRSGVAQAAIRFREPGWIAPVVLEQRWQGLPALPVGLVPISVRPAKDAGFSDKAIQIEVLNPGPARQRWLPGSDWRLSSAEYNDPKTFWEVQPGELITVILENVQSS